MIKDEGNSFVDDSESVSSAFTIKTAFLKKLTERDTSQFERKITAPKGITETPQVDSNEMNDFIA